MNEDGEEFFYTPEGLLRTNILDIGSFLIFPFGFLGLRLFLVKNLCLIIQIISRIGEVENVFMRGGVYEMFRALTAGWQFAPILRAEVLINCFLLLSLFTPPQLPS